MRLSNRLIVALSFLYLLTGCQSFEPKVQTQATEEEIQAAIDELKNSNLNKINLDYVAACKVRLKTKSESQSGNCHVVLTKNLEFLLTISHPLGGVLVKIYTDGNVLKVKDFKEKSYKEHKLIDKNSAKLPLIKDFSLEELQVVLWGRVLQSVKEDLNLRFDSNNRLKQIVKKKQKTELTVTYSRWLEYKGSHFPRVMTMLNKEDGTSIKLAITDFQPGNAGNVDINDKFTQRKSVNTKSYN